MEDELDMEVELERELQQEQEELEEELCLQQALEMDLQLEASRKRPLGKVLSLPANFVYSGGTSQDSSTLHVHDPNEQRRASSISYQSSYRAHRRQTFHSHGPLLPPSYPASGYTSVYTTEQEKITDKTEMSQMSGQKKLESMLSRRKSLRRMSSVDSRRKSSFSVGSSRRGSLFGPKAEVANLITVSKSGNIVLCPSPEQLLSLTELVCDEKTRERRILRKALSMDSRTPSDDISTECISPNVMMIPPPYPGEKSSLINILRTPEEEKAKKLTERRPSFHKQKSTETMEKIEENQLIQNLKSKKSLAEKRKSTFRQMSLDSKQTSFDKNRDICPEEIAMVVQERRPPHLRELRSKTQDILLSDESQLSTIFSEKTDSTSVEEKKEKEKPSFRRQMTAPASETVIKHSEKKLTLKSRKPSLVRQERQEIISTESLFAKDEEHDLQLNVLERRPSPVLVESCPEETAETSLTTQETEEIPHLESQNYPMSLSLDNSQLSVWEKRSPLSKDAKYGVSMETTSTSSNSTNLTNLRSDSVVSEEIERDAASKDDYKPDLTKKDDILDEIVELSDPTSTIVIVENIDQLEEKTVGDGSKERLIGTSSEEFCDTSEEDGSKQPLLTQQEH